MNFDQIVTEVLGILGYSSADYRTKVERSVNRRYHRACSSLGLDLTRRAKVSANTTIGSNEVTFSSIEKIDRIVDERSEPYTVLRELSFAEIRELGPESHDSDYPKSWAVKNATSSTVVVVLDVTAETAFALKADGLASLTNLSGLAEPAFPASFHDLLIDGALAEEYRRQKNRPDMEDAENAFEGRLSDLRMFIAKSFCADVQQGKYGSGRIRTRKVEL